MDLTRDDLRATKATIKRLYGRPARVLLAAWLLTQDVAVNLGDAQLAMLTEFAIPMSATAAELRVLASEGLLVETSVSNRVFFSLTRESPHWDAFRSIADVLGLSVSGA